MGESLQAYDDSDGLRCEIGGLKQASSTRHFEPTLQVYCNLRACIHMTIMNETARRGDGQWIVGLEVEWKVWNSQWQCGKLTTTEL